MEFLPNSHRPLFIILAVLLLIWDGVWRAIALWRAGRNSNLGWFVCLCVINTAGILPIIYIFGFSKKKQGPAPTA